MSNITTVNVKWNGKKFENIEVNMNEPGLVFKSQLFALTGVPPDRQKILMKKGGVLKDDSDMANVGIISGQLLMMIGTSEVLEAPKEKVQFMEDMTEGQLNVATAVPPGIENLGNTCYLNATLQCLNAIPEIQSSLENVSGRPTDNLTVAVRDTCKLLNTYGSTVQPFVLIQTLRARYPHFAQLDEHGHSMQQDAEECWSLLMSNIREQLAKTHPDFVKDFLSGEMMSVVKCDENPEEEPQIMVDSFHKLNCHISTNVSHVLTGLDKGLIEQLEKNSPTLNRSALYTKTSKITALPRYLPVNFIRFFWKQSEKVKAKILKKVQFPLMLDVFSLCSPELQQELIPVREKFKESEDAALAKRANLDLPPEETANSSPDASNKMPISAYYDLVAVLTHIGRSADSGHYMGWVRKKDKADQWWKFDDDKVSTVTSEEILKLDGGGDWHMAYLCLYRAKNLE